MRSRGTSAQAALLNAVHRRPGLTRADAAAEIAIPSGFAAETVARLVAAELVAESPAPATGRPGRPTTILEPHPRGPLVAAVSIGQETWQAAAVELGGTLLDPSLRPHAGDQAQVLAAVAAELERIRARFGARVQAVTVAVPGTVTGSRLLQASGLGWHDVDLSVLRSDDPSTSFLAGNDATLAGIAESRRASGSRSGWDPSAGTLLYLHLAEGIGGAVIEAGRAVRGATGTAGEFGHMPFGDPTRRCGCGTTGCWNTAFDPQALARFLTRQVPGGADGRLGHVLASASAGDPAALAAVRSAASAIGRGIAGLVNGLDPHLVVLGGAGPALLELARAETTAAYHAGLMAFRPKPPPAILAARLSGDGPLLGAADEAFARLLTDDGLKAWSARNETESASQLGSMRRETSRPVASEPAGD